MVYAGVARLVTRKPYRVELQPVNEYPTRLSGFFFHAVSMAIIW
jgi:hypothetical protein